MAHAPPGHHSVMGRPSTGGLNFPECVVYRGEQVGILCYKLALFSQKLIYDVDVATLYNIKMKRRNLNFLCFTGVSRVLDHVSNCEARVKLLLDR